MSKKPQKIKIPHRLAPFLYICFFLSGAAGLIYEVVWARQLSLFLGITGFAHTAVITAYMAGLAGGSLFFGRRSDRLKNPLKIYAWLEIGVGLYAAVTPWMFTTLQVVYANVAGATGVEGTSGHFARFSIALLALLIPTFLMGGTLPLLVRGVVSELPDVGRITSRMYGVNTLGAMSGTLLAGYVLLEQLGIRATIFIAVALNLGIALWVFLVLAKHPTRQHKTKKTRHNTPAKIRGPGETGNSVTGAGLRFALLAGFGAAGFAALLTQLAWMRAMILLVGGSVYAFTIALSSFLAGIALGSLAYSRVFRNSRIDNVLERLSHAGVVAALVGLTIIGGIPLLAHLPQWYLAGYAAGLKDHFAAFQLYIFVLAFVLMLLPTLLMGLLFPLVTTIYTGQVSQTGQSVGTAYAVNTTGTILGTLLGGLFLLPWLGIQNSLILAGVIYVAVAVVFWSLANRRLTTSWRAGVPSMGVFILLVIVSLIPRWDTAIWGPGVYYDPEAIIKRLPDSNLHDIMSSLEVLYYEEGLDGTVVVRQNDYQKYLIINGKTDASSKGDLQTQLLLGAIPALLHRDPRSALIIGLGSGITAGAVAAYDTVEEITVLEILPEVVEASEFFAEENQHVLDDPRVRVISADARNYVLSTQQKWDLIISEPSNPWISGVANLFTLEFFQMARQRLTEKGIMAQWFHAYNMSLDDMKMVLRTYTRAFDYVTVWNTQLADLILIGSNTPHSLNLERFAQIQTTEETAYDLKRAGIGSARDLLRLHLLSAEQLDSFIEGSEFNTDDHPRIEFNAPRYHYRDTALENMIAVAKHINGQPAATPVDGFYKNTARGLEVIAMDLEIDFPNPGRITNLEAYWPVWRLPIPVNSNEYDGYEIGSFRRLHWQDGQSSVRVQAWLISTGRDNTAMDAILEETITLPSIRSGGLSLGEGIAGRWLVGARQEQIELGLIWECRQKSGGFTSYSAYSLMPDPGEAQWSDKLSALASQFKFKCQPGAGIQ